MPPLSLQPQVASLEPLQPCESEVACEGPQRSSVGAVEWLIDNACAYESMLRSIRSARRSIRITQLAFDVDCVAYDVASIGFAEDGSTVLSAAILDVIAIQAVDVRILLNATLLLDTTRPFARFLSRRPVATTSLLGTIAVRGAGRFPQLLHAKMVIVDGNEAFLLGSPFANGYWDDPRHLPVDSRRPARELGGRPLHDVSLRLTGEPVAHLEQLFDDLWSQQSDRHNVSERNGLRPPNDLDGALTESLRIVCTSPPGMLPRVPEGKTEIMDVLLQGIAEARSLIYVEHQYLSSRPVIAALSEALRREPNLELIVVLNQNPDVTAYRGWQIARLNECGWLEHPRVGLFSLWSAQAGATPSSPTLLNQLFVHSKVVTVDDRWATVGSANLDGVSLQSYGDDFTGRFARWLFRDVRNFDVNVVLNEALGDRATPGGTVRELRTRLWSEHLSYDARRLESPPPEGWLSLWRERAAANLAWLRGEQTGSIADRPTGGFVLPYSTEATPVRQLAALGVAIDRETFDLRFDPGWLEVHFSPNWVRNMFL